MKQTQKSLVTLAVFLCVALAVGGVAVWVQKDEQKKEEAKEKEAKLFAFDKAKVRTVKLERDGKLVAEAARDAAGKPWKLVKPVQAEGDDATLGAIVDKLDGLKQKKDLGTETDPKQPGLDAPRFKVTLALEDKQELGLEVGADNPFDNTMYVRKLGEQTVRIVEGFQKQPFEKTTFDLRDKRVTHLDETAEIRNFSVVHDDPYTFTKDGAGWKLTGPGHETPEPADTSAADKVIASIKGLRAVEVVAESADAAALKKYGLAEPKISIELNEVAAAGGKETFRRKILLGQPKPEKGEIAVKVYAKRDDAPAIYRVEPAIVKDLAKTWFELQEKTVAKFDREAVRMLEIEAPGAAKIAVSRSKGAPKDGGVAEEKFAVEAPASGAAKRWKITSALFGLAGLKAAAFAGPAPKDAKGLQQYGLDKARVYTLLGEGGKVLARIKIGKAVPKDEKRLYAMAEGGQKVVEIEKATADDFPKSLDDVLDTPPPAAGADGGTTAVQANK
jgi:hypothetical protein